MFLIYILVLTLFDVFFVKATAPTIADSVCDL